MRLRFTAILALACLLAAVAFVGSAPHASAQSTSLSPVGDAYVDADAPDANAGVATSLVIDATPVRTAYLKFEVQGLTAAPERVTLRIFSRQSGTVPARIHPVADTAWTEPGLTYNVAPALGVVTASTKLTKGTFAEFDVTPLVQTNGLVAFGLTTDSTASRSFDSREGANPPQLVIESGASPTTTTEPPTTTTEPPTTTTEPPTTTTEPPTTTTEPPTTTTESPTTTTEPPTTTTEPSTNEPLTPVADSYVKSDAQNANFGTSNPLVVIGSPEWRGYVTFDVQGLNTPPTRVTLRVMSRTTAKTNIRVHAVADTTWTEGGITYANAPEIGPVLTESGVPTAGVYMTFDVTSLVQGNGLVSFALTTTGSASRKMDSREGISPPLLEIDTAQPADGVVVAAAGDAACATSDTNFNGGDGVPGYCHMKAVSDVATGINPDHVFMLGDAQYGSASLAEFTASYDPTWGRLRSITHPVLGNHEYGTSGAAGYYEYFGDAATPRQPGCRRNCEGYYSFNTGSWHVVVLNAECTRLDGGAGCAVGSRQEQWLRADLAAHPAACTLVVGHRPRWSSNSYASASIQPLIEAMYEAGVDVYLAGHAHSYERFAPQDAAGQRDDMRGIRQIVVGTGGVYYSGFGTVAANSEIRRAAVFGVLRMTLSDSGYSWQFVADPATPFSDAGTGSCH